MFRVRVFKVVKFHVLNVNKGVSVEGLVSKIRKVFIYTGNHTNHEDMTGPELLEK